MHGNPMYHGADFRVGGSKALAGALALAPSVPGAHQQLRWRSDNIEGGRAVGAERAGVTDRNRLSRRRLGVSSSRGALNL